jgi:hypothetical protein
MEALSPYQQLRQVEFTVQGLRPGWEAARPAQKAYDALLRQVQASQHALRDYELSVDDARAQARLLPRGIKSIEGVRAGILKASEFELIGAVQVAHMTAQLDELIDRLR